MMDQVPTIRRLVLSAACVTAKECATNSKFPEGLQQGEYQIVFYQSRSTVLKYRMENFANLPI